LLVLVYGPEYAAAAGTFTILALTIVINTPIIIGFNAIIAAGKQNIYLWSAPIEAFSNMGLNALLIPRLGIEGAALSTLVTQLAVNTYLWSKIRKL
jgi:O-antigen/teichoic acid export membrane protein